MDLYEYTLSKKSKLDLLVLGVVMKKDFCDIKIYDYNTGEQLINGTMEIRSSYITSRLHLSHPWDKTDYEKYTSNTLEWRKDFKASTADKNSYVCWKLGIKVNYNGKAYATQAHAFMFTHDNADSWSDNKWEDERQYKLMLEQR